MAQYQEGQKLQGSDGNVYVVVNGVPTLANAAPSNVVAPSAARVAEKAREESRRDEDQQMQREAAARATEAANRSADASNRQAGAAERTASNQSYDNVMKLRSAYESTPIVKEYRVGITQLGAALQRTDDATGDNALIYDYAKAMDPGSVVRESEMGMAASGAPAYEAAAANLKKQFNIDGGGQLTPALRQKLKREIAVKVGSMNKQYSAQRIRYADDAKAAGIDPRNVTGDHDGDVFMPQIKAYQDEQRGQDQTSEITPDGPRMEAASGDTREELDPRATSQIDSLMNAGASLATVNAVLKRSGHPGISAGSFRSAQQWIKANPGKQYFGSNITKTVPLTTMQSLSGSPLGAGAARFANSATAGMVGAMAGEKGQGALDAMAAANPRSAMAGDILGGVAGATALELGAVAAAPAALTRYAPRIADTLYGGLSGFNAAQEGEGGTGALTGAGAGLLGGLVGQRIANGAAAGLRGVTNPAAQYLRSRGVPLTVGQAVGNSGPIGRSIKGVEDALTSVPGVGSVINARRMEGLEGFNRAAFEAGAAPAGIPVNAVGADGVQQMRQRVGQAYDNALGGTQIDTNNPQFLSAMETLVEAANNIPDVNGAPQAAATALNARILGGTDDATGLMSGRNFQEAYRGLARTGRERAAGDYGHEVGQVMRQGQDALAGALETQNPGAFTAFRAANSTNRNANVLAEAVNKAKNAEQELFTPAQLNMADAGSARRLSGPLASAAGDRPFYDLSRAGQDLLPSKLPDSGTATRGIVAAGALGGLTGGGAGAVFGDAETGAGVGLGATLALALGGSQPAQRILTSALLDRPELAVTIGNAIQRNSRAGAWAGTGVLTPLAIGAQN